MHDMSLVAWYHRCTPANKRIVAWLAMPSQAQAGDSCACPAAGFVSYEEFQSQALGLGAAVSAVTMLFWVAVLLLVRHTRSLLNGSAQHMTVQTV